MNWFILSLVAPFFWSIANYLDKYLLTKRNKGVGSGGLLIISALVSGIISFFIYVHIGPSVHVIDSQVAGALILSGIFEALYIYFYFVALERESTTTVVSLFQLAPIMGLIFGYLMLSEIPNKDQLVGVGLVLLGTLFVIKKKGERFSFKNGVLPLMLASTAFVGIFSTIFKIAAEDVPFWTAIYWQYLGIAALGFILFMAIGPHRRETHLMLGKSGFKVLLITTFAEIANVGALLTTNAAVLLAPVALVLSIASVQPVIVFIEGLLLMIFFPRFLKGEDRVRLNFQYILGILLTCAGGAYIYMH